MNNREKSLLGCTIAVGLHRRAMTLVSRFQGSPFRMTLSTLVEAALEDKLSELEDRFGKTHPLPLASEVSDQYMTTRQAARAIKRSPARVLQMVKAGQIKAVKSGQHWKIDRASVETVSDRG